MPKMKIAVVPRPGADFELQEREVPQPGPGQVRIRVQACGICMGDDLVKEGHWPGLTYPRTPGHEVAGVIAELGPGVTTWKQGQRVGVGWHGGHDSTCFYCRRGDFVNCAQQKITGISYDGGYAEYMLAPVESLAQMPDSLDVAEAAPLMCAGLTTFNSLRHSDAMPGDVVAVQGIGGLGHLGVQFASKFGYRVVAISRGKKAESLAQKLGAQLYIDTSSSDAAAELQKLGGANVILTTAPSGKAMTALLPGLAPRGTLLVVGAGPDPIEVSTVVMIRGSKHIQAWASGIPADAEDTLRFSEMTGIHPLVEKFPLDQVNQAYARMKSGKAQFRVVLTM